MEPFQSTLDGFGVGSGSGWGSVGEATLGDGMLMRGPAALPVPGSNRADATPSANRMGAVPSPVLPPTHEICMGELLMGESQHHRGSLRVSVEAGPDKVLVSHEDLELQIQEVAAFAREPTASSQSPREVARHRVHMVDREERIAGVSWKPTR